ncbi:glycerate kinase [Paenibacillus periandrae]|uniref:glycerate kinase n=1 Tax=Paenibacillus periandrae TaxID=1761741 RepID=UPI003B8313B7
MKVAEIIARAIQHEIPSAKVIKIPIEDEGEGTIDALVADFKRIQQTDTAARPFR